MPPKPSGERIRVDKWLWAARLLKTRALAAEAVKAGRVKVNGVAAKPSKEVGAGDRLELRTGPVRVTVDVRGIAPRRGPARQRSSTRRPRRAATRASVTRRSAALRARTEARAGARPSATGAGSRR